MADTTSSVLRLYVCAILVGVSHNTAVQLGYAFGPTEDCELYQIFADIFEGKFGIKVSEFILESDQGSGLRKFAKGLEATQRFVYFRVTWLISSSVIPFRSLNC
jgi:hypothetical protein